MDRDKSQGRGIGAPGRITSIEVIFEIRKDADGEFYHLVTAWKATNQE